MKSKSPMYPTELVEFIILGNLSLVGEMSLEEMSESFHPYLDCTTCAQNLENRGYLRKVVSTRELKYEITHKGRQYWKHTNESWGKKEKSMTFDVKKGTVESITYNPVSGQKLEELVKKIKKGISQEEVEELIKELNEK